MGNVTQSVNKVQFSVGVFDATREKLGETDKPCLGERVISVLIRSTVRHELISNACTIRASVERAMKMI